jgi:hypothetical protein
MNVRPIKYQEDMARTWQRLLPQTVSIFVMSSAGKELN